MAPTTKQLEVFTVVINNTVCPNCIEELYIDEHTADNEFVISGNDVFHIGCYFEFNNMHTDSPDGDQ